MNVEQLAAVRTGAEMSNMKPYMDAEISGLLKAVVNNVLSAVNNGTLTPEIAMSKWMEYIAYVKLAQKIEQRIRVGKSSGAEVEKSLDFPLRSGYTAPSNT